MRSIWNGTLSFGLVSIPVKLYSATEDRRISFDLLDSSDHARIRYKRVNESSGKEVEWSDIVKGYQKEDGYVVLDDEDFDQANMKKSKTIEIEEFVEESEVSDLLFKKPYYLEPRKEGGKSYNLLRDALIESGKLGVATFVMRQKEHLCLVGVYQKVLVVHVIRFADEIRDTAKLELTDSKVNQKELDVALTLIDKYSEKFDFEKYKDVYNDQLMEIIQAKESGRKPTVEKIDTTPTPEDDLMAKLKASLEARKKKSQAG